MEFRHLPVAGGIYDQNPEMLDRFQYIWMKLNEQREKEEAERSRKQGGPQGKPRRMRGASRASY
jgi:hypothetical protein